MFNKTISPVIYDAGDYHYMLAVYLNVTRDCNYYDVPRRFIEEAKNLFKMQKTARWLGISVETAYRILNRPYEVSESKMLDIRNLFYVMEYVMRDFQKFQEKCQSYGIIIKTED